MALILALLFACQTEPATLVSEPATPTVDLAAEEEADTVTWSTLPGLLPEGEPAFPAVLAGLRIGQPEAEARAVLERVRHKKLRAPPDQVIESTLVLAGRLEAFPTVGVTLLVEPEGLSAVDLAVPRNEALFMATQAWGQPDTTKPVPSGVPQPQWVHEGLVVTLIEIDEDQAILKFAGAGEH